MERVMLHALVAGLLLPASPSPPPPDPWAAIRFLAGEWSGESDGQAGKGTVKRSCRFVLGDKFLHEQNVSTYPPQPNNPKGEVHEHWSFFSYDRARRALVFRQVHQEGIVETFELARGEGPFEVYSQNRFKRVRRP
jgi:hypothetical protein